jgi:anti-sigma factor RsiW
VDCGAKVSKYWQLVHGFSKSVMTRPTVPGPDCPQDDDVDWSEVAAGLWPELKAAQLIMHAALCDHCGPLLRAATSVEDDPTPQEEQMLAELTPPLRPDPIHPRVMPAPSRRRVLIWLIPAIALVVIVGVVSEMWSSSGAALSGLKFAELAVRAHREHEQGKLELEVRSDSQDTINEWFRQKSEFALTLPASPAAPGETRPYRLEGARLMQVGTKSAAFIAYHGQPGKVQTDDVSLIVVPDSGAVASGGVEVDFEKVSFHYRTVEGYKVVTWSVHGLAYALVSQEGNRTQRSCMICHSAMRDRDLTQTPAPLQADRNSIVPVVHLLHEWTFISLPWISGSVASKPE